MYVGMVMWSRGQNCELKCTSRLDSYSDGSIFSHCQKSCVKNIIKQLFRELCEQKNATRYISAIGNLLPHFRNVSLRSCSQETWDAMLISSMQVQGTKDPQLDSPLSIMLQLIKVAHNLLIHLGKWIDELKVADSLACITDPLQTKTMTGCENHNKLNRLRPAIRTSKLVLPSVIHKAWL